MAVTRADFMAAPDYRAVATTHFFVDLLNGSRTVLVAIIAVAIGLSNAQVGLALLLYNVGNALSQPFFGILADRIGPRALVVLGLGWMALFYGLAALAGDWIALAALTVAGLGSGAFHPSGTMVASQASTARRTQATSIFFMAGQLGLFFGPIATGILLQQFGRPGYLVLPLLAVVVVVWGWRTIEGDRYHYVVRRSAELSPGKISLALPDGAGRDATILAIIILLTATVNITVINFAPKLFTEMGLPAAQVGILAGILMLGAAVGGVAGGSLADRYGGRIVVFGALMAATAPLFFYVAATGWVLIIWLALGGFLMGMPHSILVLRAQALLPGRRATASGLILGFMFFSGSIGSYAVGLIADQIGLPAALQMLAVLPPLSAVAALGLRKLRTVEGELAPPETARTSS